MFQIAADDGIIRVSRTSPIRGYRELANAWFVVTSKGVGVAVWECKGGCIGYFFLIPLKSKPDRTTTYSTDL